MDLPFSAPTFPNWKHNIQSMRVTEEAMLVNPQSTSFLRATPLSGLTVVGQVLGLLPSFIFAGGLSVVCWIQLPLTSALVTDCA